MGKCLQITFGIINFLLWLGGAGLFGLSVWLVVNPESFFDFAEDTNNLINGENATLPEELTIFTDKIANGLYLSMAAGKFGLRHRGRRNLGLTHGLGHVSSMRKSKALSRGSDIPFCQSLKFISLGIILLLVGFLGCCGAARKSRCMLNSYAIIMVLAIL